MSASIHHLMQKGPGSGLPAAAMPNPAPFAQGAHHTMGLAVHAYVHTILEAANSLLRDGRLTLIAFHTCGYPPVPTIVVLDCDYVRNLARVGIASYDRQGTDAQGAYRIGQFQRCGVNVEWFERGQP